MPSLSKEVLERFVFLKRELDRIVDDFVSDRAAGTHSNIFLPCDVAETDGDVRITVDIPGIRIGELEVSISPEFIVIEGTKPRQEVRAGRRYHILERAAGRFVKVIPIPGTGDLSRVEATYKRGVLSVRYSKILDRRGTLRRVVIQ